MVADHCLFLLYRQIEGSTTMTFGIYDEHTLYLAAEIAQDGSRPPDVLRATIFCFVV